MPRMRARPRDCVERDVTDVCAMSPVIRASRHRRHESPPLPVGLAYWFAGFLYGRGKACGSMGSMFQT